MSADAVVEAPPVVATETAAVLGDAPVDAPQVPQRDPARLARILRNPGKDKPEPRAWRGDIAHNATGSAYTWDTVGVSAAFVTDAVKDLTEEECERASQRLRPLLEEEKALAERAARFGGSLETAKAPAVVSTGVAVDELAAAKRLARFGAIPAEPKKQPQQKADNNNNNKKGDKKKDANAKKDKAVKAEKKGDAAKKTDKKDRFAKKAEEVAAFFKAPQDDATQAAMAARAARFGGAAPAAAPAAEATA
jgi:hypothetical protein